MRRWALLLVLALLGSFAPREAAAGEPVWGKDLVAGKTFPLPFGIGVTYFAQDQDYRIDKLTLGVPGLPPIPTQFLKIENSIDEINAKFDAWLLPYLNVFGIAGHLNGDTKVDLSALPVPLPLPFTSLKINYDGEVYGVGVTLAGGTDHFFGSVTGIATNTQLSGDFDSSASAKVLTPRVGAYNDRGAIYAGAMYQKAEESHKGNIVLPFLGPVPFAVDLSQKDDWNWIAGGSWAFRPDWTLELEGGFGDRSHLNAAVTWRF